MDDDVLLYYNIKNINLLHDNSFFKATVIYNNLTEKVIFGLENYNKFIVFSVNNFLKIKERKDKINKLNEC